MIILFYSFLFIFTKFVTSFLLKIWVLSGAKVDQSSKSRKLLQNEYLVGKIGVDTAENEPLSGTGCACEPARCASEAVFLKEELQDPND